MPNILLNNMRPAGLLLTNLKVGATEVKYVKRGDGKFFYDTLNDTTYSAITISKFSYSTATVAASGGDTSKPSYSYSQTITPVGHAGNYTSSTITSGASVSFSKVSGDGATVNTSTGVVTWESRGTTYSTSLRSAVVRIKVSLNGKEATKDCTVYLNKNVIISASYSSTSAGTLTNPATYAAGGATKSVANKTTASAAVTLTFSSNATSTSYDSYGTLTTTYSWSSNQTYATLTSSNKSSLDVTMTSRGTTYASGTRSATITRKASFNYVLDAAYNNASVAAITANKSATATVTQAANTITISSVTVSGGALTNPTAYAAKGGTKSVANKTAATATGVLKFTSGSEVAATTDYGSWTGPTYSWASNQTYATLTSSNAASLNVTMANRTTTTGEARTATITRTATFKFTLSSTYGGASKSNTANTTATVTQNANSRTLTSVSIAAYQPDASWWATESWGAIKAGDAYLGVRGTYHYTYSSESTSTSDAGMLRTGLTFTTSMAEVHTNGGLHIKNRGTTIGNARSGTVYWTYNNLTSNTLSYTLVGNYITSITAKVSNANYNHFYYATTAASGATTSPTLNGSATYTFTSGSTGTYSASNVPTGVTWTFTRTYSVVTSVTGATLNTTSGAVTWTNNTTTSARSVNIRSVLTVTCTHSSTYSAGGTKTSTLTHTSTSSQTKGSVAYSINAASLSFTAAGGTKTPALTYTTKWNGIATATTTSLSGYTLTETTDPNSKFSTNGTTVTASKNTDTTSSYSATYTITKSGYTSGTLTCTVAKDSVSSYATPTVSLSVSDIPASGGDRSSGTCTYSLVVTYVSGNTKTITSGGTVAYTCKNASGTTVTKISASSLGTTLKARTKVGTITATVTLNGKSGSKTVDVYQAINQVTSIAFTPSSSTNSSKHIYYNTYSLAASAATATATKNASFIATYSSGSTATAPTTGGSATYTRTYSISGTGFSKNDSTGNVTAASRGTTIGNARTGTLTSNLTITWTPTSIGSAKTCTATASYTFTQAANLVTAVTTLVSYSIGDATAAGGTITATKSGSCTLKFTSGSSIAGQTVSGGYTGGTISCNSWSFSGSATGATLASDTGNVTWANRGTTFGNARSISVTAKRTYSFTHNSTYGGTTITGSEGSTSDSSTQAGNYVTKVVATTSSGYSTHVTYSNISAAGGSLSPTGHGNATYTFSSGSTTTNGSTTWTTAGTTTYTRTYSGTLATGFTAINSSTGAVTASSRGSTIGNSRSLTVTAKLTVKFVHSSTYSAGGTVTSATLTHSPTCTQNGNYITSVTAKVSNTTNSPYHVYYANKSAAAGSVSPTTNGSCTYTFSSGSTGTYSNSTTPSGVTWTFTRTYSGSATGATVNTSTGAVTWTANTSTSSRSVTITSNLTVTCTHSSTYSAGGTVSSAVLSHTPKCTQNGDSISSTAITLSSNKYTVSGGGAPYGGGSCTLTAKVTKTWVSGNKTYDKPTLSSNQTWLTLGSINSSYNATATFDWHNNTSQRSAVVTATYSGVTSKTLTLYQRPIPTYTASFTVSNYDYETLWMLCAGVPNYNNPDKYDCILSREHVEGFENGGTLPVNAVGGSSLTIVAVGSIAYIFAWQNNLWVLKTSFTHKNENYYISFAF